MQEWTFDYTGNVQTFTVPKTGYYKLEVWGAQGGDNYHTDGIGGYGGYSYGNSSATANAKLYVVVGGKGAKGLESANSLAGGYNGGGNAGGSWNSSTTTGGSGGGATHIATRSGLLSSLSSYQSSILIVAGGGGGTGADQSWSKVENNSYGGSGGGISGIRGHCLSKTNTDVVGYGGTQTSGGSKCTSSSLCTNAASGSFGQGGQGGYLSSKNAGSGGGGGWYGGGGGQHGSDGDTGGGGGGSGYIGNSLLLANKRMYQYTYYIGTTEQACTSSTATATYTVCTTSTGHAIANAANTGNGYAKITYLGTSI